MCASAESALFTTVIICARLGRVCEVVSPTDSESRVEFVFRARLGCTYPT